MLFSLFPYTPITLLPIWVMRTRYIGTGWREDVRCRLPRYTADQANHRFAQRTITKILSVLQRAQPAQGAIRLLAAPLWAIASATLDQQASSHPLAVLALTVSRAPTAQLRVREAHAVCEHSSSRRIGA